MKCDMKTMLKAGLGLAAVAIVGYAAFPAARELILAIRVRSCFSYCVR